MLNNENNEDNQLTV